MNHSVKEHIVLEITFNNQLMIIKTDNNIVNIDLNQVSKKLLNATDIERALYKVSPSGYGVHWPLIDEDISLHALLK
jgi:hypothetical protein